MTSGFYNYLKLVNNATPYAKRLERLGCRIFGEVPRPTSEKSMKIVTKFSEQPLEQRPWVAPTYYPRHIETHQLIKKLRNYGLFRDEHLDFQEEIRRLRVARGKGAPKKGEGKRSKK